MPLRDLQIIDARHPCGLMTPFDWFSIQVVELYLFNMRPRIATDGVVKVLLRLYPEDQLKEPKVIHGNVLHLHWPFDFTSAEACGTYDRKRRILDATHAALLWLANHCGWDNASLHRAYKASIEAGLVFSGWLCKRPVRHPDRPVKANCFFEYDDEDLHVYAVVFDRRGNELGRKPMFTTVAGYWTWRHLISELSWTRKTRLRTTPGKNLGGESPHEISVAEFLPPPVP